MTINETSPFEVRFYQGAGYTSVEAFAECDEAIDYALDMRDLGHSVKVWALEYVNGKVTEELIDLHDAMLDRDQENADVAYADGLEAIDGPEYDAAGNCYSDADNWC